MKKLILLLLILSMMSCASKRDVLYLQDLEETELVKIDSIFSTTRIQSSDILYIQLTAFDDESLDPFRFQKSGQSSRSYNVNMEALKTVGYLVDKQGDIDFPNLGKISVSGKTSGEVAEVLKEAISEYVTDPTVSVRIINFKVAVLGEVQRPGMFNLNEEGLTLPQALSLAGDLTINGERHKVLIIRNEGGERVYKYIDLTQSDWMNSPFYYLKQNDVVYVQPNNSRVKQSGYIGTVGNVLSLLSIMISLSVLLFK